MARYALKQIHAQLLLVSKGCIMNSMRGIQSCVCHTDASEISRSAECDPRHVLETTNVEFERINVPGFQGHISLPLWKCDSRRRCSPRQNGSLEKRPSGKKAEEKEKDKKK